MAASLADPTDDRRLHDLYRMYDIAGRLLYVGVTNGGLRRFMEHSKDKTWWREVDSIKVEHAHCTRSVIERMERDAIVAESPLYNVAHNHGIAPQTACVAVSRPLATPAGSWSASGLIARVATAPDGQREILETLIVQQLGERGPLSRNMLLSAVRDGGAKIGSTPFTDAVNIMVLKGAVSETNGPRGAKVIAVIGQAVAA